MKRRLLELCLLAYPRGSRGRDREFLRDLALDLGERQGFGRQMLSLLRGGLGERVVRRRGSVGRIAVASLIAALALVLGASVLDAPARADHEIESFACRVDRASADGCGEGRRRLAAYERRGWDCIAAGNLDRRSSSWECTRTFE